jgi:hypothetical protein
MAKVCTGYTDQEIEVDGETFYKQEVQVHLVDTEDAIIDISVKSTKHMRFIGNRYTMPLSEIVDNDEYDEKARAYCKRMSGSGRSDSPVPWEEQPLGVAGITQNQVEDELEPHVQLMDVYLPKEKWFLTLVVGGANVPPLKGGSWYACNPYIPLIFEYVEGNVLPMPPARHWLDICSAVDNATAKLLNQLKRQKTIGIVRAGSEGDKRRMDQTPDGGACRIDSQYGIQETRIGGPDPVAQAFTIQLRQLASDIAGNINAIAGLDMSADTATEANLMAQGSSGTLGAYRNKVNKWWSKIMQSIAWFSYNDALHNPSSMIERGDPRVGITIYGNGPGREHEGWTYEDRMNFNFFDFMFDVVPASNMYRSPEQRAGAITRLIGGIFGQFAPIAAQQGINIDIAKWVELTAELSNLGPEVKELIMRTDLPEVPANTGAYDSLSAGKPNGNYVHQSRPSTVTRQGSDMQMVSELMGAAKSAGSGSRGAQE